MNCPNCKTTTLVMTERQGVEIDHCPQCRGVWLDRGELDKIIERSARFDDDDDNRRPQAAPPPPPAYGAPPPPYGAPPPPYRGDYRRDDDDRSYKRKKKRSFLEDIFDFD